MSDNKPNGCGPWWFPFNVGADYFKVQCDKHDYDYINGKPKIIADTNFLRDMLLKASKDSKIRVIQAYVYYFIVLWFGNLSYRKLNDE